MSQGKKNRALRNRRKKLLLKLLRQVLKGDFDNTPVLLNNLYDNTTPRKQYLGPRDRDTYNYGYMELDEMGAGSPDVWS